MHNGIILKNDVRMGLTMMIRIKPQQGRWINWFWIIFKDFKFGIIFFLNSNFKKKTISSSCNIVTCVDENKTPHECSPIYTFFWFISLTIPFKVPIFTIQQFFFCFFSFVFFRHYLFLCFSVERTTCPFTQRVSATVQIPASPFLTRFLFYTPHNVVILRFISNPINTKFTAIIWFHDIFRAILSLFISQLLFPSFL